MIITIQSWNTGKVIHFIRWPSWASITFCRHWRVPSQKAISLFIQLESRLDGENLTEHESCSWLEYFIYVAQATLVTFLGDWRLEAHALQYMRSNLLASDWYWNLAIYGMFIESCSVLEAKLVWTAIQCYICMTKSWRNNVERSNFVQLIPIYNVNFILFCSVCFVKYWW